MGQEKKQLYGLVLEDYSSPRYNPRAKLYVGTMQELLDFTEALEKESVPQYKYLITAIRSYASNPGATHTVCGVEYPILTPVKEIGRKEINLTDHIWIHKTELRACEYLMHADSIWSSHVLVEYESQLILCSKASFDQLKISTALLGWIQLNKDIASFPGMVCNNYYGEPKKCVSHLSLYGENKIYRTEEEKNKAMEDLPGMMEVDLHSMIEEIMREV